MSTLESVSLTEAFLHNNPYMIQLYVVFPTAGKEPTQYKRKHNRSMNRFMRR